MTPCTSSCMAHGRCSHPNPNPNPNPDPHQVFVVYGCVFDELYEAQKVNATATTDELLMYSWGWSIMQAHARRTLGAR
eukprot:scaffold100759_cov78-Phaeocystis_antarctica.AAC.3